MFMTIFLILFITFIKIEALVKKRIIFVILNIADIIQDLQWNLSKSNILGSKLFCLFRIAVYSAFGLPFRQFVLNYDKHGE
jgi:hypothetical protein